jgi:hypothetical protein
VSRLSAITFRELLQRLADAWAALDTEAATQCFTADWRWHIGNVEDVP